MQIMLDHYYKNLNNENLTNKRRQPMKKFECSMQKKIESLKKTNERLFTLYDIHDKYSDFGKPSCWRNPQFWKDYEDYYNKSYPTMGIEIVLNDDDSVDVSSNGDFIMNYSWKNGRHSSTAADGSGFKHPGFNFRDDLSMIYRSAMGKPMGPYKSVYVDESKKSETGERMAINDYANKRFYDPDEFVKYVRKVVKDGSYLSVDSVVSMDILNKANRLVQNNDYKKSEGIVRPEDPDELKVGKYSASILEDDGGLVAFTPYFYDDVQSAENAVYDYLKEHDSEIKELGIVPSKAVITQVVKNPRGWNDSKDIKEITIDSSNYPKKYSKSKELYYRLMQYRDNETKEWLPIIVYISTLPAGWYYAGVAPTDNLGGYDYDEYSRSFLKTCKSGTDKCDQELVQSMKKYFLYAMDDLNPVEVTNLTAYIPKGKPFIGKE